MMNSDSKPHQNHEVDRMKSVHRKVYRHGVVRFSQMSYRGECLKNYEGRDVILLFDPDRILEMRTYAQTDNGTPGEFLGYIKMINFKGLGLSEDQLETGNFSLKNLKAILANIRANMKTADEYNRMKAKAVVFREDLIDRKLKKKK
jgi:putative transposase